MEEIASLFSVLTNLLQPGQLNTLPQCEEIINGIWDPKAAESLCLVQEILFKLRKSPGKKTPQHRPATIGHLTKS
jgi:hypothetical protein